MPPGKGGSETNRNFSLLDLAEDLEGIIAKDEHENEEYSPREHESTCTQPLWLFLADVVVLEHQNPVREQRGQEEKIDRDIDEDSDLHHARPCVSVELLDVIDHEKRKRGELDENGDPLQHNRCQS